MSKHNIRLMPFLATTSNEFSSFRQNKLNMFNLFRLCQQISQKLVQQCCQNRHRSRTLLRHCCVLFQHCCECGRGLGKHPREASVGSLTHGTRPAIPPYASNWLKTVRRTITSDKRTIWLYVTFNQIKLNVSPLCDKNLTQMNPRRLSQIRYSYSYVYTLVHRDYTMHAQRSFVNCSTPWE